MNGHRLLPHPADFQLEAWASTKHACIGEAVAALVRSFIEIRGANQGRTWRVHTRVSATPDADALVAVLDEVIYLVDTQNGVVREVSIDEEVDELLVCFDLVDLADVEIVGAAPKAISLHELEFTHDDSGWHCLVTVDV